MPEKEKVKKTEEDITKQARENIPPEVWEQLPDNIKKEIDPDYEPPPPTAIFQGASPDLNESLNRLRDGFEKIGLTLIGRMGEFATTLERVMMAVARLDKVENLVSEVKYLLKGLQKTLDNVNITLNKFDSMNLTLELENIKNMLQDSGATITLPTKTSPPKVIGKPEKVKPTEQANAKEISKPTEPTEPISEENTSTSPLEQIIEEKIEPTEKVQKLFVCLKTIVTTSMTYDDLAKNLELARDAISQCYRWVPILYDIGKAARKYKSKSSANLSTEDINEIQKNLVTWEEKILKQ